jgi:hypothetical protein
VLGIGGPLSCLVAKWTGLEGSTPPNISWLYLHKVLSMSLCRSDQDIDASFEYLSVMPYCVSYALV